MPSFYEHRIQYITLIILLTLACLLAFRLYDVKDRQAFLLATHFGQDYTILEHHRSTMVVNDTDHSYRVHFTYNGNALTSRLDIASVTQLNAPK